MGERITDKLVTALVPPDKGNLIIYDEKVSGFGIRSSSGGTRSFILIYRNEEGAERRYTIGRYGRDQWSVEAARKEAGQLKKKVARGEDPQGDKRVKREAETLADLCKTYIDDHLPLKRPSSRRNDHQMMDKIIKPKLGTRKVAAITHNDVIKFHRAMGATPIRANRVLSLLSRLFNLAIRRGLLAYNPCRGVKRFHEPKRTRYLNTEEIGRLIQVLGNHPETRVARVDPRRADADTARAEALEWARRPPTWFGFVC